MTHWQLHKFERVNTLTSTCSRRSKHWQVNKFETFNTLTCTYVRHSQHISVSKKVRPTSRLSKIYCYSQSRNKLKNTLVCCDIDSRIIVDQQIDKNTLMNLNKCTGNEAMWINKSSKIHYFVVELIFRLLDKSIILSPHNRSLTKREWT